MELEKRNEETDFEYHKRLIYGKLVDKTLSDADYSELAEMIYGKSYSSDVARRMMYGSKKTLELAERDGVDITTKATLSDMDNKLLEIQKERRRLSDQRREYSKVVSSDARWEHLLDVVKASAKSIPPINLLAGKSASPDASIRNESQSEAVLVLSDWHYGMTVDNVFNKYDTKICVDRVHRVVENAVERIVLNRCKTLHVVVLGDLIHGNCHVSARVASEEVAVEQLMHASELLAQTIYSLSKYVNETYVYITYGNHARSVQNKNDSIHRDNVERIVPWWLKWRLDTYSNIYVMDNEQDEFLFVNACGHDICATHGDLDCVKTSPRLLSTLFNKKYGKNIEYILLGDKHHRESFEELGVTSVICGSLCGTDDYAHERRLYSDPSQLLLVVTPEDGVDAEYRIRCA